MKKILTGLSLAALITTGCQKDKSAGDTKPQTEASQTDTTAAKPAMPTNHGAGAAAPAPTAPGAVTGKVLETMNSGGYTYVKVGAATGEVWAAGPELKVAVGDEVSFAGGAPMPNYHSKTLDRTFEVVYFVGAINLGGTAAGAAANPHGEMGGAGANPHGAVPSPEAAAIETIEKAKGGQTVADVFAGKDALSGKQVIVRGKVVKFNGGIMNRNWIHLQDGTGGSGTNDLIITTNDLASVGDIVTATGTVATNKDFGSGYSYALLVEEAKLTK